MNPEKVIKKISKKTKAIIITHIYGFPVDMEKIIKIAKINKYKNYRGFSRNDWSKIQE